MEIRPVRLSDAPVLCEIYGYYVEHYPYSFEYVPPTVEEFEKRIADITAFFPFFVCESEGEVLGFAYAHWLKERKAYRWHCETTIYVKKGVTQKGVGGKLYEKLLPVLQKQGFVKVYAILGCPNEGSAHFHEKMDFSYEATLHDMGYKFDSWHDIIYYVKELNPLGENIPEPVAYSEIIQQENNQRR